MKNKCGIFALLLLVLLSLAAGCASSTAPTVEVGGEVLPSLYSVVGEKKITGTSKSISTGLAEVELTYQGVAVDELNSYIESLVSDGYMITQEASATEDGQTYQIGKEASKEGNIILISFYFEDGGSAVINYAVGAGTITPEAEG
ncbi:hypothetical protein [Christensenella tenuis]|jgi:hypothetical protein|uniref:Uncharacterized protein n=1 Tax=Christensenella tenuis TaxID=2763033 RepID=A0ABR7EGA3_9FIRM|nr:hypothetical protein [Christensenella tenuis]MBC5648698.1 hypothetical protein [Christensenella tenuis]